MAAVIPEAMLREVHPALAGWLRNLGLHVRPGLAGFFTPAELASGAAATELHSDLGLPDEDFVQLAVDLDRVVGLAQVSAELRRRSFSTLEDHSFHWERAVRQRTETREQAEERFRALDLRRQRAATPPLAVQPRLGHRPRRLPPRDADPAGRDEAEDLARRFWISKVLKMLQEMNAPILAIISASHRPVELLNSHLAGRRSATLGARVRAWTRYQGWLKMSYGVSYPQSAHHLLDYLLDRRAEPCTRGTLSALYAMMRFMEQTVGYAEADRWTSSVQVQELIKGIIAGAASTVGPRSVGPANSPLVEILAKLERVVCDDDTPSCRRILAWWMVSSSWACFRFDDHRGIPPHGISLMNGDVDFTIERSKTTGKDKSVQLRRAVIGKEAWLVEPDWMKTGLGLLQESVSAPRSYLLTQFGQDGTPIRRELGYSEYAGRMRAVLAQLMDADGATLGGEFATYLRPHSWRSFLPSAIVALGGPSDSLRWLSAWKTQSAEAYVRTSRTRTVALQASVARIVRLHRGGRIPWVRETP